MIRLRSKEMICFLLIFLTITSDAFGSDDNFLHDDIIKMESLIQDSDDIQNSPLESSNILRIIHTRPLFEESRRPLEQTKTSEKPTLIIEGHATTVELVGTVYSTGEKIAGFALGGEEIVWLQRNDYLGDWKIDEIQPNQVRLVNLGTSRLIGLRESVGKEDEHVEG